MDLYDKLNFPDELKEMFDVSPDDCLDTIHEAIKYSADHNITANRAMAKEIAEANLFKAIRDYKDCEMNDDICAYILANQLILLTINRTPDPLELRGTRKV